VGQTKRFWWAGFGPQVVLCPPLLLSVSLSFEKCNLCDSLSIVIRPFWREFAITLEKFWNTLTVYKLRINVSWLVFFIVTANTLFITMISTSASCLTRERETAALSKGHRRQLWQSASLQRQQVKQRRQHQQQLQHLQQCQQQHQK
jgi:hypothetical protein